MVRKIHAKSYEECKELITKHSHDQLYIIFVGTKTDGASWCPHCITSETVLEKMFAPLPDSTIILEVEVGDRKTWKDSKNPYRKDPELQLVRIPTVIHWNKKRRLVEEQCTKEDIIKLFLEDTD